MQENQINHEVVPGASTNNLATKEETISLNEIDCENSQNTSIDPTPSELNKLVEVSPAQAPIYCIRYENGCQNLVYSYFTKYTAICDSCSMYIDEQLKLSPYPHDLCP